MITKICKNCEKEFKIKPCYKNTAKYCSRKCFNVGKVGWKHSEKTKKEMSRTRQGEKNGNWKGGIYHHSAGYIFIKSPNHPFTDCRRYVLRSHLVMEKHLGRYLEFGEVVHHINGIKDDDRIENLELFLSENKHQEVCHSMEYRKKERNSLGQFVRPKELVVNL